jgi:formylglycine-generating enzyme required for sulfatase activity
MLGNVWEWCSDLRASGSNDAVHDPYGRGLRFVRGGLWKHEAFAVRAARRSMRPPGARLPYLGFRLARDHAAPS